MARAVRWCAKEDLTEHQIQCRFNRMVRGAETAYRSFRLAHASANGGKRTKVTAAQLKNSGVVSGIPDYQYPVARGGYCGFWIEFKTPEGSLSDDQKEIIELLTMEGNKVEVHTDADEAFSAILAYENNSQRFFVGS